MPTAQDTDDGRSTNDNKRLGTAAEEQRAEARDGRRTPEAWFDVEGDSEDVVEVKSTERRLSSGRRGRYQIKQYNHENLVDHGGVYDFVLRDTDGDSWDLEDPDDTAATRLSVPASTVEDWRQDRGLKWPDGGKLKLPWTDVHDVADVEGEQ